MAKDGNTCHASLESSFGFSVLQQAVAKFQCPVKSVIGQGETGELLVGW
jgi:hypothetical protein